MNYKHGGSGHPLYGVWKAMKVRCTNPNRRYSYLYLEKGIEVCPEWSNNFAIFKDWAEVNGWEQGMQIDRKNPDLGYNPDNCRVVTPKINSDNRNPNRGKRYRGVSKHRDKWRSRITHNGKLISLGVFDTDREAAIAYNNYAKQVSNNIRLNIINK